MFKLLKRLIMLAFVLVLAGAIGLFFIDGILAKGIEKGGSYALGVPVTRDPRSVGLTSGKVTIDELRIANPPGFGSDPFFAMKTLKTEVPLRRLLEQKIEIPKLTISGVGVSLEQSLSGSNWSAITANLERFQTGDKSPEKAGGKRFVIKELVIEDVRVGVSLRATPAAALRQDVPIPTIRLHDVGAEGGQGVLIGELAAIVIQSVLGAAAAHGGGALPAAAIADLSRSVSSLVRQGVGGAQLNQVVEDLRKDPGRAVESLGGILGGKKK